MILAGDIGGTNTRLALVEVTTEELRIVVGKNLSKSRADQPRSGAC